MLMGNHLFVIFAVLDVSFAINSCINHSFFTFINILNQINQIHTVTLAQETLYETFVTVWI